MTTLHSWSIAAALVSAVTPWFVVRVALAVARNHARAVDAPEVWMSEEVSGGSVEDVASRATSRVRKVRLIFAAELTLVLCCNLAGHALLDLDWSAPQPWAGFVLVGSAAIGITGCALAVSSDLARRRYAHHDAR